MKIYIKTFLGGILAATGSLILEAVFLAMVSIIKGEPTNNVGLYFIVLAALIEETLKYATLKKTLRADLESGKIILSSLFLGAGFAFLEIIFHSFGSFSLSKDLLSTYLGIFLLHCLTAVILGWYLSFSKHSLKISWFFWAIAVFLHACFNLAIFYEFSYFVLNAILVIGLFFLALRIKISRRSLPSAKKSTII